MCFDFGIFDFNSVCASPTSLFKFLVYTPVCSWIPEVLALVTAAAVPGERDVVGSIYLGEGWRSKFNGVASCDGRVAWGVAWGVALGDGFGVVCVDIDCFVAFLFYSLILACSLTLSIFSWVDSLILSDLVFAESFICMSKSSCNGFISSRNL